MELYKGEEWDVVFVYWCQEFVEYYIVSCNKETLNDLSPEAW